MSTLKGTPIGKGVAQEFGIKGDQGLPYEETRFESLPDDVLLLIFSFYLDQAQDEEILSGELEEWHILVHVCRRWRSVVFASPRHLHLRLVCTETTSAEEMNDIWPALPIIIRTSNNRKKWGVRHKRNITTALEHSDRVSEISFGDVPNWILEEFVAVMKEPLPFLTSLRISSSQGTLLALPDFFLGGSAPRLRSLHLKLLASPALPTLLSSTSDLNELFLRLVPDSPYISPATMISCLSAATRLKVLHLNFRFSFLPLPHLNREGQHLALPTRIVLPDLSHFLWTGTNEYLNDLLALIDAPQLYSIRMAFDYYYSPICETPQVALFIGRMERFKEPYRANIAIFSHSAELILRLRTQTAHYPSLKFVVNYPPVWPLSYLVKSCRSSFLPLSAVERLDINDIRSQRSTENTGEWLELLGLFIAVKNLHVSKKAALHVVLALQELSVERQTEVLPALRNLFIEGLEASGPVQEAVEQFVATRTRRSPVAVHPLDSIQIMDGKSHSC